MTNIQWSAEDFDNRLHRPGTKGRDGMCSWVENCASDPVHTTRVDYPSGEHRTFALCRMHQGRLQQLYQADGAGVS